MMRAVFVTLALMAVLAQPGRAAEPAPGEVLAEDQHFAFRLPDEPGPLDPALNGSAAGADLLRQLFEGLMVDGPDGVMRPGMALRHQVSADGLVHSFDLRPALWSDGNPVVAGDFVAGWRRVADPATGSPHGWYLALMGVARAREVLAGTAPPKALGIEAVDDATLRVTLAAPRADLAAMLSHPATYPVPPHVLAEGWAAPGALVGNGAFLADAVPEDADPDTALRMRRNPRYWDAEAVRLEALTAIPVNTGAEALARYAAGDLDRVGIPAGQLAAQQAARPGHVAQLPRGCTYAFVLNLSPDGPEALKDVRVRRALQLGLDRDLIVDELLKGGQRPAWGWTHWAVAGDQPPITDEPAMDQQARNARAQALLAEAGYFPGRPLRLKLIYNTGEDHKMIALAARDFWEPLGVQVSLENLEWTQLAARLDKQDFEIARYGWCADYNAPASFLDWFRRDGVNAGRWDNPVYDALLDEARLSDDPGPLYQQAETILAQELPVVTLYHYADTALIRPQIRGLATANPLGIWYAKDMYRIAE